MVTPSLTLKNDYPDATPAIRTADFPYDDVKWCTVSLSDIINANKRLEATVYDVEGKHAREVVENCKWESVPLYGTDGLSSAYICGRFKRIWLKSSDLPIYQPSSISDINPPSDGFISHKTKVNLDALRVHKGQILLTCSGTVGNVALVSDTLDNKIFSHDLIRMDVKNPEDIGFVYAFLRSKIGSTILQTNSYGAVIQHIEPEHLSEISVPNPDSEIKVRINDLILRSFELRDKSNKLIDEATALLKAELKLSSITEFETNRFDDRIDINNYNVKLSQLSGRLDGSYHVPIVKAIKIHLHKHASEVTVVGDNRITSQIILAGIFKRVYVGEAYGIPFLGGKEITQLAPKTEKYLSRTHHMKRYEKELRVRENMILVTDRGSIGTVAMVPKHWDGWAVSQNVLKIVPASDDMAGYLYIFLNSDIGKILMQRQTYGSVVDMIDNGKLANVEFPLLKNAGVQIEINRLALEANSMRYEAYRLEQKAMQIMNDEVLFA